MLLHNGSGGFLQPSTCFFPDPASYLPLPATPPPTQHQHHQPHHLQQQQPQPPQHFDIDAFLSHPSSSPYHHAPSSPTAATPACQLPQQHTPPYPQHQQNYISSGLHGAASSGGGGSGYASCYPHPYQHHNNHHGSSPHSACYHSGGSCSCGCPYKPVQETFLYKILTGKGYKNDAMCRAGNHSHHHHNNNNNHNHHHSSNTNHHRRHHHNAAHLAAGRSVDNLHCIGGGGVGVGGGAGYGGDGASHGGVGADFAMVASCCYAASSGMPAMPMSAAAFPPPIPGF